MADQLSAQDWIDEGLKALVKSGFTALKAEPLAKALGVSRGSFYWHFKDIDAFHAAILKRWRDVQFYSGAPLSVALTVAAYRWFQPNYTLNGTYIDGNRVVHKWLNRLPSRRPDGSYYEFAGITVMVYAGDGRFSFQEDMYNRHETDKVLQEWGAAQRP